MICFGVLLFVLFLVFKCLYIFYPLNSKNHKHLDPKIQCFKSFALLVPAFNEESVIINCIRSLKELQYPNYRVFIIDDGSTDHTFDVINRFLNLVPAQLKEDNRLEYKPVLAKYRSSVYPNFYVISKVNGGKADALNAGISCCSQEIVLTLDADCIIKHDALSVMNKAFQNRSVVAAGGTVHITQSITSEEKLIFKLKNLIKYQVIQYLNAFYLHKFTQSNFKSLIVISGAFGAFKRNLLIAVNGYRKSVGEDMDITLKIHRYIKQNKKRYKMLYVPKSVCYTECPESFKNLMRQRIRWQKAFKDCTAKYGLQMFRNFNIGVSLFFVFDYLILGTLTAFLLLLVPVYLIMNCSLSMMFIIIFSTDFVLGIAECAVSKKIAARYRFSFSKDDNIRVGFYLPVKILIFRILNILFIIAGTISYFFNKNQWNQAERLGRHFSGAAELPLDDNNMQVTAVHELSSVNNS